MKSYERERLKAQVMDMRDKGMSIPEIAEEVGLSDGAIYKYIAECVEISDREWYDNFESRWDEICEPFRDLIRIKYVNEGRADALADKSVIIMEETGVESGGHTMRWITQKQVRA